MWPNSPIPLGPLYYSFWPLMLVVYLLAELWMPQLREQRVAVSLIVIGLYTLYAAFIWTR